MSLEQRIEELTAAVQQLTATVQQVNATAPAPIAAAAAPATPKRTAAPPVEDTPDVVESAVEPPPEMVYEDLTKALVKLGKHLAAAGKPPKEVRDVGIAVLARLGAEKLSDLRDKPETWPRLLDVVETVITGGEV